MALPPPPPGFVPEGRAPSPRLRPRKLADAPPPPPQGAVVDPLATVRSSGANVTSGYRDAARNRRVGGVPGSDHLNADAIDLTPGKGQSWGDLHAMASEVAKTRGGTVIDESRTKKPHVHLSLPGWGQAPGLPAPPVGFAPDTSFGPMPMSAADAKAGADAVSEDDIKALRIKTIQGNGFDPAREAELIARVEAENSPPVAPLPPQQSRIGVAPFLNAVTDSLGGEPGIKPAPTFDDRGISSQVLFKDEQPAQSRFNLSEDQKRQIREFVSQAKDANDLDAFARTVSGGRVGVENAGKVLAHFRKTGKVGGVTDVPLPIPVSNPDGGGGSFARGVADPFNFLDEFGAVADTLGATDGRESIWNSESSFGDILGSNIDQNRGILAADERDHPYARLGGQLTSGILIPFGGGARTIGQLAKVGAAEGFAAGFGAGEGNPLQRLPNAVVGSGFGAAGGATLGALVKGGSALISTARNRLGKSVSDDALSTFNDAAMETVPVVDDAMQSAGPTPAARFQPQGGALGPRQRDYLHVGDLPPPPPGFVPESLGSVRRVGDAATPEQMAAMAARIQPGDVTPIPPNRFASLDEFQAANPGSVQPIAAPDEFGTLTTRRFPSTGARPIYQRGPVDLVGFLRSQGGIRDQGGELSHLGIDNARRTADFAGGEGFLGKLVKDDGMSLDEAAHKAWEAGYFPDHADRPDVNDFLDALQGTHSGFNRRFMPDDVDEISAFEASRGQREAVESAAQEGRTLAERVGQPATLDDLEANRPPATAYEDLPTLGGKAGNIDLSRLETRGDISRALTQTEHMFGGFDAARRGRISHAETAALADELGMKADDLLKRRQGQALNAEEALAARRILARSGDELVALAQKTKGGSDGDLATFQKAMLRHAAIQEQVTGATAEAGRTLSQFKAAARSKDHNEAIMRAIIDGAGGRDKLEDVAQKIIDLQKVPGALNKFALDAAKPTWKDKAVELYYNSLLSGPQTHAVNIVSNALTSLLQIPEHAVASGLGQLRRGSVDRVLASELGPRIVGLMQGAQEGLRAARLTFKTGKVPDHVSKVEAAMQEAIPGKVGHVLRTPTRALSAEDEFFKAIARRSELAALAVRKATGEGLAGNDLTKRIEELNANPPADMMDQALDYARYLTFQRPVGPVAGAVLQATRDQPWLKLILPFVRTPTNILKFAAERSPAAPLLKEVRADFTAGGARRDLAIARMTMGSGLGLLVTEMARDGNITGGGPSDENARRLLMADGWQPYSLKVGDRYYSYQRLDPLATTLGVAADYVDLQSAMTDRQREQLGTLITASIISNLSDKTWLSGLSDAVSAIHDPQRNGPQLINRMVGSVAVPTAFSQVARTIDPTAREVKGPIEAIQNRIPGLSDNLRPRLDAWGRPVVKEGGMGPDIVSPVYQSTRRHEEENDEALRLGLKVSDPSRIVAGRRLSDDEFHAYRMQVGTMMRDGLGQALANPSWKGLSDDQKRKAFDKIKRDARKIAREGMGMAHGDDGQEVAIPPPPHGFLPQ